MIKTTPITLGMLKECIVHDVAFARAEAAQTPILPGNIEVRATVTLAVEVR
jgi:hypothetical protein